MPKITVTAFGQTDQGLVRKENEDDLFVSKQYNIYAVADGLGGLPGGAEASKLTVKRLNEIIEEEKPSEIIDFNDYLEKINMSVTEASKKVYGEDLGMATTLTVAQVHGNQLHIGHVGDTGIFLFRGGSCKQLTIDHTMAQDIRDRMGPDDDTYIPEYYNHTLTRCIGHTESMIVDIYDFEIQAKDRLLIYSDGVTKTWEEEELTKAIQESKSPEEFVKLIIETGNERGGPDNITAISLFIK